jgi:hypothetical protein
MASAMDLHSVVEGWENHKSKPECLPICLYNILLNLSKSEYYYEFLPISIQKMKAVCGYVPNLGSSWDIATRGIKSRLQRRGIKDWALKSEEGKTVKKEKMCKIIENDNCSYPILSLGPEYMRDRYSVPLEGVPHQWMGHCVVALKCDDDCVKFYDPYNPYGTAYFNPIYQLKKNIFEGYWVASDPVKGMMWFQRMNSSLMQFGGEVQ